MPVATTYGRGVGMVEPPDGLPNVDPPPLTGPTDSFSLLPGLYGFHHNAGFRAT